VTGLGFDEAVQRSKKTLASLMIHGHDWATNEGWQAHQQAQAGVYLIMTDAPLLFEQAEHDSDMYWAARHGIAHAVRLGMTLEPAVKDWLIRLLRGEITPPKKSAGRLSAAGPHFVIFLAVYDLVSAGMTATRNDATSDQCACDAVAKALAETGRQPQTYEGVKRVWFSIRSGFNNSESLREILKSRVEPKST
jgi:hypothetical protein